MAAIMRLTWLLAFVENFLGMKVLFAALTGASQAGSLSPQVSNFYPDSVGLSWD